MFSIPRFCVTIECFKSVKERIITIKLVSVSTRPAPTTGEKRHFFPQPPPLIVHQPYAQLDFSKVVILNVPFPKWRYVISFYSMRSLTIAFQDQEKKCIIINCSISHRFTKLSKGKRPGKSTLTFSLVSKFRTKTTS